MSAPDPQKTQDEQAKVEEQVITQEKAGFRAHWPHWARQLPRRSFPDNPRADYQLIDRQKMRALLKDADPEALRRLDADIDFLDHELLRLFRQRDHQAAFQQNRYRLYQIGFIVLATFATLIGSLQALTLGSVPDWVPLLAFIETLIALGTTYLATISGRESPLPMWLSNRRRAEHLRREYFRFLMNIPPYNDLDAIQRRLMLSQRAAEINRGFYPETDGSSQGRPA